VRPLIESAQREVILISPYFIPSDRGIDMLGALVQRGVRVRVLTNSLASTDVPAVHSGYARQRPKLLARGVELHEFRPAPATTSGRTALLGSSRASLHTKAVIVDREQVSVGSMNLDPRSRTHNTEVAVFAHSAILGDRLAGLFDETVMPGHSFRVTLAIAGDENAALVWTGEKDGQPERYGSEPLAGFWRRAAAAILGVFAPDDML
jgi:putative cardiolipin synthase